MTNEEAIELLKDIANVRPAKKYMLDLAIEALETASHTCGNCARNYDKTFDYGKIGVRCDLTDRRLKETDYCSAWRAE